jgi:L-lactate dehydrogenase complex protein LldG
VSETTRRQVLEAIRQALAVPVEATLPEPFPPSSMTGEEERIAGFIREAEAAGAQVASVPEAEAARAQVRRWVEACGARRVLCAATPLVKQLGLGREPLVGAGVELVQAEAAASDRRQRALAADVGITDADFGLADTGTLALRATPEQGRLVSLLPPVHIALLSRRRIVADLAACLRALEMKKEARHTSLLTLITGPSRTADIEQTLTVGVHGPGTLYILLLD